MGFGYSGFDVGFSVFGIMFTLVFIVTIGIFIVIIVKGASTWNKNNNFPRLTVVAEVVSKRIDVTHHRHANAGDVTGAHGMLVDGDMGKLSFQGTRYLSFERIETSCSSRQ